MTGRDIRVGQASLGLIQMFPDWDLETCDRVAAALIDEYDRNDFERDVQADIDRLPVTG